jgi:hypothetical protein
VPLDEYAHYFLKQKELEEGYYGGPGLWLREGALEDLEARALAGLARPYVIRSMAAGLGVSLDEGEEAGVIAAAEEAAAAMGGPEAFAEYLAGEHLTEALYRRGVETGALEAKIKAAIAGEGSAYKLSREELSARLDRTYAKTEHICLALGDGGHEERLRFANAIWERAKGGADDFETLMDMYDEDPAGAPGRSRLFSFGEMAPTYEDMAFQTEVGEISDVFMSGGDIYILRRVRLSAAEAEELAPQIESSYYDEVFGDLYYNARQSLAITYSEAG